MSARWWSVLAIVLLAGVSSRARAWEPFRSRNGNVEDGNARLSANDPRGALAAYDRAARELPSEPGVHLNRGIALLAQGQFDRAREALLIATEPPASQAIRADAYENLGLAFYKQGDAAAGQQNHQEAQRLFREAADAFRRSLRTRPGDANTAWNYELARRRIREEEQKQQAQQQQNQQQQQSQQQQNQQQQNQNAQNQQGDQNAGNQDPQRSQENPDAQNSPQNQPQNANQGQEPGGQDPARENNQGGNPQQEQGQNAQSGEPEDRQGQQGQDAQGQSPEQRPGQTGGPQPPPQPAGQAQQGQQARNGLPSDVARVLDALQDSEDNLERHRARARGMRENRRPTKDW